jgi:hypothetical protein
MTAANEYMLLTGDKDGRVIMRDMRETNSIVQEFETEPYLSGIKMSQCSENIIAVLADKVSVYE